MSDDLDYERVLLVKPDIFIYRIPPRSSNRGYRASDWKLDEPDWTGRLRLIAKGRKVLLKLEEKASGQLFAECPIDKYPGISVEPVSDSSRYFVLRIVSNTGNTAFIGIGFADRGDSFDLNVALQDHFKIIEKEIESEKESEKEPLKLDLKFKEGETIKVNLNIAKKSSLSRPKGKSGTSATGILPPPPGSSNVKLPAPPVAASASGGGKTAAATLASSSSSNSTQQQSTQETPPNLEESDDTFMAEFDKLSVNQPNNTKPGQTGEGMENNSSSSSSSQNATAVSSNNSGWAQF